MAEIYWICKFEIRVAISNKEASPLESLLFLEVHVKRDILVLSVFFALN